MSYRSLTPSRVQTAQPSPQEDLVFRALADPTRRQILDRLRHGSSTTGDVASKFAMSRYGVMKHLKVLQEAGLVLVQPRGRERWHFLNPVPIRSIYRRWIKPFEEPSSDHLLKLKQTLESEVVLELDSDSNGRKELEMSQEQLVGVIHVLSEVVIEAGADRVWEALVDQTTSWWHSDFYTAPEPRSFLIEASLGGRMYEDWGEGQGLIWGVVTGMRRGKMLQVVGDTGRAWGGPSRGFMTWTLEEEAGSTRLRFEQSQFGAVSKTTQDSLGSGWDFLFGECLKPWVESGRSPDQVVFTDAG